MFWNDEPKKTITACAHCGAKAGVRTQCSVQQVHYFKEFDGDEICGHCGEQVGNGPSECRNGAGHRFL